jgi:hypothetical protein
MACTWWWLVSPPLQEEAMRKRAQNRTRVSEADCVSMTTKALFAGVGRRKICCWGDMATFLSPTTYPLYWLRHSYTSTSGSLEVKWGSWGGLFPSSRPPMYNHSVERWFRSNPPRRLCRVSPFLYCVQSETATLTIRLLHVNERGEPTGLLVTDGTGGVWETTGQSPKTWWILPTRYRGI